MELTHWLTHLTADQLLEFQGDEDPNGQNEDGDPNGATQEDEDVIEELKKLLRQIE